MAVISIIMIFTHIEPDNRLPMHDALEFCEAS